MRSFIDIYISIQIWPCFRNAKKSAKLNIFLFETDSTNLVSTEYSHSRRIKHLRYEFLCFFSEQLNELYHATSRYKFERIWRPCYSICFIRPRHETQMFVFVLPFYMPELWIFIVRFVRALPWMPKIRKTSIKLYQLATNTWKLCIASNFYNQFMVFW